MLPELLNGELANKLCKTCQTAKPLTEFYRSKAGYLSSRCKPCHNIQAEQWRKANLEKHKATGLRWRQVNSERHNANGRRWHKDSRKRSNANAMRWQKANPEKVKATARRTREKNRLHIRVVHTQYCKRRYHNDPGYRVAVLYRTRVLLALNGNPKAGTTEALVGCSFEFLRTYLENQFSLRPGMSWQTYGFWHIDHIRPCASFDLRDPEQQKLCFHYTNLRPIWAVENLQKSDKYE